MVKPFERNVSSKYGAPMGRRSDGLEEIVGKVHLQRVPSCDGGDYDPGGAYWGGIYGDASLWCAWGESDDLQLEHYVRAPSREAAKALLLTQYPDLKFYR